MRAGVRGELVAGGREGTEAGALGVAEAGAWTEAGVRGGEGSGGGVAIVMFGSAPRPTLSSRAADAAVSAAKLGARPV